MQNKFNELFDNYVPATGKAATVAGEIVRATSRIAARWQNDGDQLGTDYGNETVNPAARFLAATSPAFSALIFSIWDGDNMGNYALDYANFIDKLVELTVKFIEKHPELKTRENKVDMFSMATEMDVDPCAVEEEEEW